MVGSSPKCGATSLEKWAKTHNALPRVHGYAHDCLRCFFVRDPLERFISLYRNKSEGGYGNLNLIKGKSPEELISFIESNKVWNQHWGLQSEILGDVEAILLPLELMTPLLGAEKYNTSTGEVVMSRSIINRIYAHYDADKKLYQLSKGVRKW